MRTVFHHAESGTELFCDVPLIVNKNDMQGMKSATTYAKRIGLESLSGIAPEDDDGNAAASAPPQKQERAAPAKPRTEDRAFYTQMETMTRAATDTDELNSIYTAHAADIKASHFKADILKLFGERKTELLEPAQ
jgi:hypothetical protein